jgi:hypothetical protein
MMSVRGIGVSIAVVLGATAGFAHADETVIVRGQVTAQTGVDFLFSTSGENLVGQPFDIKYQVFDTNPQYTPFNQTFNPPYGSSVSGGYENGTSPVMASITIGGAAYDDGGLWTNGEALRKAPASGQSEVYYQAEDANWGPGDLDVWSEISSATDPFVTNPDYRTALTHAVTSGDVATGGLTESYSDPTNPFALDTANLTLTPTSISVLDTTTQTGGGDPPGVPEPATWSLLLLGVGTAGIALRRRRSVAAGVGRQVGRIAGPG